MQSGQGSENVEISTQKRKKAGLKPASFVGAP